ncbi:MAG: ABC transporter permease [candidate division NC10 bacterium]|nr:ABC transporter permease [candidate division NC10 bacterium]
MQRRFRGVVGDLPAIPAIILLIVVSASIFGPWIALYDAEESDLINQFVPPIWKAGGTLAHPLGTDHMGRDFLSRLIVGARISLLVGGMAVFFSGSIGTVVAIAAGYLGGTVDAVLMRMTDAMLSMPYLLIGVALAGIMGPGLLNLVVVLAVLGWASYARVIRSEVLRVKTQDFVVLARITGCSTIRILWKHIFPNVVNTLIVLATLQLGITIILAASLSFLGMGVPPPTPEWGLMVAEGREFIDSAWWLITFPGLCILLTCLAANLLGDWLRLRLDPKYRQRA